MRAFMQSALGVVTACPQVEPWGGAFSLHVSDPCAALGDLARWSRRRYTGRIIACPEPPGHAWDAVLIDQVLRTEWHGTVEHLAADSDVAVASALLDLECESDYAMFGWSSREKLWAFQISDLCCPDIVVITGAQVMADVDRGGRRLAFAGLSQWFKTLSPNTRLVLNADDSELCWAALDCPAAIDWIGSNDQMNLAASGIAVGPGRSELTVDGRGWSIEHPDEIKVSSILAAVAVGKLLGIEPAQAVFILSRSLRDWTKTRIRVA